MTSSYGIGGKPYMGPIGGGGWQVGPHVLDPAGANGSKPVDAAATRPSADKFEKPKPSAAKAPKPPTGVQGNRMAGLWGGLKNWAGKGFAAFNVLDAANQARQGKWNEAAGSLATWGLTSAASNPWLAPFALDLMDTQHAGPRGPLPELTAEQKALQAKLRKEGAESGSFRYIDGDSSASTSELETIHHHPDLPGPAGNEVGSDADTSTPGLQGPGAPGANPYKPGTQEHGMFIWAQKHGKMAEDVLDKVENRGLKQAGYTAIREALGKTPTTPPASAYEGGTGLTGGEFEAPELKGGVTYDPDFKVDYSQNPQGFLKDKISLLTTSASSLQQPNFDGTSQPIGGDSPKDPQPEQDFNNANTNPAEVVPTTYHPLNIKPSEEAEKANAEYGAMKFEFDPAKNMMVRIK